MDFFSILKFMKELFINILKYYDLLIYLIIFYILLKL